MAVPRMTREDLKTRLEGSPDERPVLVDVRLKYPFEHSTMTLPGALRFAPGAVDPSHLPRNRDVVLYDSDPEELVAERAASELIRLGYRAFALAGGISAWAAAKFPTDNKPAPQPAVPAAGAIKG